LFGFLTTEPNAAVAPIHPKAMPVILTTPAEVDLWLLADASKALELQRPLPDDALRIVASGGRRMARARMPCSIVIKAHCSRFDALRGFQPYHDFVCMTAIRKWQPFALWAANLGFSGEVVCGKLLNPDDQSSLSRSPHSKASRYGYR
jgi:hypothetical protein